MSATTNLGKVSVTPEGAWAITNAYEILDIVTSGGSSYLAKQDVPTGVPLSNTSYWIMIAEKGDGGEVTSASASISGGYGTPGVAVTAGGTAHERTLAFAFTNLRGEKGETGNGIDSVYKTGTSGLVDTYTILFTDGSTYEFEVNNGTASIDNTLTKSGWAADAKVVGDTKASIDGFYETMGVGVADNLTPYSEDSGATQDIPFIAQGTGCGNGESVVDTGSYLQFKKKLGNTVCVNQLCDYSKLRTGTYSGITVTKSGDKLIANGTASANAYIPLFSPAKIATISGHKYLVVLPSGTAVSYYDDSSTQQYNNATSSIIFTGSGVDITPSARISNGTTVTNVVISMSLIDLTLWFGSNDRIPSDLLSHPENWGRYYAGSLDYNAGTLESADGTVLKSIGRNVWDEEWQNGYYSLVGVFTPYAGYVACKNKIRVIPNTAYHQYSGGGNMGRICFYDADENLISTIANYAVPTSTSVTFITPANAHFMTFDMTSGYGGTYNRDITLSLYYSGESGYDQYYPFSVLTEVDTGSEGLRSAGAVADEKTPDGTITRRVGVVDLGTLSWTYDSTLKYFSSSGIQSLVKVPDTTMLPANISCAKYVREAATYVYNSAPSFDKSVGILGTAGICISDQSYTDPAVFKTALSGVYLYYELATYTTEQGTAFAENIPCDDFGSMYWTQTKGIPQGNEIFYPVDYKASIDTLYNRVEGDMSAIVIDSQLEVVADRIPEAPSEDGTYTLKATVSSGTKTYSWVADE